MVESESEHQRKVEPAAGFSESFHLRINKPLSLRFIVADSLGNGLITYEWVDIPVGHYTLGSNGWPQPQHEITEDHEWVYVYFVGDRRFRSRYQFHLDDKKHFTRMIDPVDDSTATP